MLVDFKVVQLLCSRICHDLIGPAGAVSVGIELFGEAPSGEDGPDEHLEMVADSARQLSRRLSFFRVAFGFSGGNGRLDDARGLAFDMLENGRVELDWPQDSGLSLKRDIKSDVVKLVLNMVLLGIDSLPRGGGLNVHFAELAEGLGIAMTATGNGARIKDDLYACLAANVPVEELTAYNVHGYFAARLAESLDSEIEISHSRTDQVNLAALVPDFDKV